MQLVIVKWVDIETHVGWCEDLQDVEPPVFETVGYLVTKTKKKLILTDTVPQIGNVTVFPMGCVMDIREVK